MRVSIEQSNIRVEELTDFSLRDTLDCGQCFRFDEQPDGSFAGFAGDKFLRVWQPEETSLLFYDTTPKVFETVWRRYFDLDFDYPGVKAALSKLHPALCDACAFAPGIRILNQDPWEALCTFILSQNNNIKRIKGIVARLCEAFGEPLPGGGRAFPRPEALSNLCKEDLAPLRCGFRDAYLLDAAQKVSSGEVSLQTLTDAPLEEARARLQAIRGVGPKVAECALLYGLHRLSAFPMDVWMKRAMETLFPGVSVSDFGEYAGVAQQYIFHYSRLHPGLFPEKTEQKKRKAG